MGCGEALAYLHDADRFRKCVSQLEVGVRFTTGVSHQARTGRGTFVYYGIGLSVRAVAAASIGGERDSPELGHVT